MQTFEEEAKKFLGVLLVTSLQAKLANALRTHATKKGYKKTESGLPDTHPHACETGKLPNRIVDKFRDERLARLPKLLDLEAPSQLVY